jgi:dTDP-4-dehydrorhamnose reductase
LASVPTDRQPAIPPNGNRDAYQQAPLIIGGGGLVGSALMEVLGADLCQSTYSERAAGEAIPFSLSRVADDASLAERLFDLTQPDVIYITAGMTYVDGCETQVREAYRINGDAPAVIATVARARGIRTVYYSTEYVFDGVAGPHAESDSPQPLCVYGKSKLAGEEALLDVDPGALIIRTTVVYGPEVRGKNFAYQVARKLSAGARMTVPDDQVSTPTYSRDLAAAAVELVEYGATGVFHVVGDERMDRAAFARQIASLTDLDASLIDGAPTETLQQQARRPLNAGLSTARLREILPDFKTRSIADAIRHWREHPRGTPWPA